jgi:type VI secretion system protein ImpA
MISIENLLVNISDEQPAGVDLQANPTPEYIVIKKTRMLARKQEREALATGDYATKDLKDWLIIVDLAQTILQQESKDLNVSAWLVEALIRINGFEGFNKGLELVLGLVTNYWDTLHPMPDEEGVQSRISPLTGLFGAESEGALVAQINSVPLIKTNNLSIALWQYQQSVSNANVTDPDKIKRNKKHGVIALNEIKAELHVLNISALTETKTTVEACLDILNKLFVKLNELTGRQDLISLSYAKNSLQSCLDVVNSFIQEIQPVQVKDVSVNQSGEVHVEALLNLKSCQVKSKQEACDQLSAIALYFENNEPHSPVPYLLKRAVRWSNLTLPELLMEIMPNEQSLNHSYRLIGFEQAVDNAGHQPSESFSEEE